MSTYPAPHPATDRPSWTALVDAEAEAYALGYREGFGAGIAKADRDVCDAVRRMLAQLRGGGLL